MIRASRKQNVTALRSANVKHTSMEPLAYANLFDHPQPQNSIASEVHENQRTEPRFDPEPDALEAVVQAESSWAVRGKIADVSYSGIALFVKDVSQLSVGMPVVLFYRKERVRTIVRYILPQDHRFRVGFEIDSRSSAPT